MKERGFTWLKRHAQDQSSPLSILLQFKRLPLPPQNTVGEDFFSLFAPACEMPRLLSSSLQAFIHTYQGPASIRVIEIPATQHTELALALHLCATLQKLRLPWESRGAPQSLGVRTVTIPNPT
jgi:hypothetical protein